ncbi:PEP-CTERM sorting domain-containing protein [Oxalobacteraceae bacterium OTU3CINTB1]|nr:PEP-CTERM sorting domain-containing protein [Oxalobacteraceae bacterium OTU3CINTB1]
MQTKFNAIKAAVLAVSLAFSGAAFAGQTYNSQAIVDAGGLVLNFDGQNFNGTPVVGIPVMELTNTVNAQDSFLAFCIQPKVDLQQHTVYTGATATVSNSVKALYETSYDNAIKNADGQKAFQLALWELVADDGKIYDNTGAQYFISGSDSSADAAFQMLNLASQHTVLSNMYTYTSFTGTGSNGLASQQLLGVSMAAAVPEASTWAMLGLGLGMVGFMGRRKSSQGQKFA